MSKAEEYADKFDYDYAECNPRKAVIETYNTGYQQAKQDAREEMKKIVKKYEAQGNRCKAQSLDNNETDNSYFWDGFENCAENILRDLQRNK